MSSSLPERPHLDHLKAQAKQLLAALRAETPEAITRFTRNLPELQGVPPDGSNQHRFALHDAQSVVAREYGFKSWTELVREVERIRATDGITSEAQTTLIRAALSDNYSKCVRLLELYPALPKSSITLALVCGDSKTVQRALTAPDFVATKLDPNGWLPLEYVSYSRLHRLGSEFATGLFKAAHLLLEAGADVNASHPWDSNEKMPLSVLYGAAGESGNKEVAKLLLEHGANPNDGESVYHAAEHYWPEILELLLENGADISSLSERWGNTPLYFLAGYRPSDPTFASAMQGAKWLLEHGADPNIGCGKEEETVLHRACRTSNAPLVQLLLAHGADANMKRSDGRTAYALACITGNESAARLLEHAGADLTLNDADASLSQCLAGTKAQAGAIPGWVVSKLAEFGEVSVLRRVLEAGQNPDTTGEAGATPLHWASFCGHTECVDLLLKHRAPIGAKDIQYQATPLGWAIQAIGWHRNPAGNYSRIIRSLLDAGADQNEITACLDRGEIEPEIAKELTAL